MNTKALTVCFCLLISCLIGTCVPIRDAGATDPATPEMVITVIGTGKIQGEDVDTGRTQAISNALISAIDRAAGDLMPLPLKIDRFKTLNNSLYNEPERFVAGFKVLAETVNGKTYRALVEATVSMTALRKQLSETKLLPEEAPSRRILLLISEQNVDDRAPGFWWGKDPSSAKGTSESRLTAVLQQQGISVIPHEQSQSSVADEKSGIQPSGISASPSDAEAVAVGKRFQAEIVVVASATAQNVGNAMGETQKSFKGIFSGRVLRTDTGEKIGDIYRTAVAVGSDTQSGGRQALNDAGALAAEVLISLLKAPPVKKSDAPISATLIVEGTRKLSNFVNFRILLKEMPMVGDIETRSIKPNETTLVIHLKGTTQALADALMLKSNDNFGINISKVSEDTIHLSLISK